MMKNATSLCSDESLRLLLYGDEQGSQFEAAQRHLDTCTDCQLRFDELAAGQEEWAEAKRLLAVGEAERLLTDEEADRSWSVAGHRHPPKEWSDSMASQLLSPPSHPEMLGRIGRYDIERLIGAGGMGVVFKAFDSELNRPVAVKVLAPHLAGSGAARSRFAREARAAAAVVDEHVVAIHNVEADGEWPFLVMQYVAGESLQTRLDRCGPLEICEILRIGMQTARGLAAAHSQGLIHRDVKPSNILLEESVDRALLTDFGLARTVDDASLTHTGCHPGTPQFMSPEQARGESVDQRSDLFSLGSVMYTMCTGRPPFRAETTFGILRRITDTEPRPIREINPDIPEWLCAIISKLMSKRADDRFESAREVAELFEECLAHVQQPTVVPLPLKIEIVAGLAKSSDSAGVPKFLATSAARRSIQWLIAAVLITGVLIFAGVLISIELNKGTLTIQCEADGVPIKITQGDKVVEKLAVNRMGASVRIAAGKYVVEIDGEADGITIKNGIVELQRRGQRIVKVVLDEAPRTADSRNRDQNPPNRLNRRSYMLQFSGRDETHMVIPKLRYDGSHPITLEATVMSLYRGSIIGDFNGAGLGLTVADGFCTFHVNDGRAADNGYASITSRTRIRYRMTTGHEKPVHIAGVLDGNELRLFVDGKLEGKETIGKFKKSKFPFMIGADPGGQGEPTQFLQGIIDEVCVSKTALYDKDFVPPSEFKSDEHTMVLYRFDEGEGDVANDASDNGLHAKIHNGEWIEAKAERETATSVVDYSKYGQAAGLMRWAATLNSRGEHAHVKLDDEGRVTYVHLGGGDITDEGLSHLKELKDVETLELTYTYGCSAEGLRHVQQMTNVKKINLWGNYNFSAGVGYLSGMTKVETLFLHKLRVTDDDMKFVKGMKGCKFFQMTLNPTVTDAGIAHLAGLTELESIYLTCPQLTDECLKYFHDMHRLNSLSISSPHVTNAGLQRLSKTLPNLKTVNKEPVEKLFEKKSAEKPADGESRPDRKQDIDGRYKDTTGKSPSPDGNIASNPRPQRILGFVPRLEEVKRDKQAKVPASQWPNALEEIRKGMAKRFPKMELKQDYRGEHGSQHLFYRQGNDAISVTLTHCNTPRAAGEALRLTDQQFNARPPADIRVKGVGDEAYVHGTPQHTGTFLMCYSNIYVHINASSRGLQLTAARDIADCLERVAHTATMKE